MVLGWILSICENLWQCFTPLHVTDSTTPCPAELMLLPRNSTWTWDFNLIPLDSYCLVRTGYHDNSYLFFSTAYKWLFCSALACPQRGHRKMWVFPLHETPAPLKCQSEPRDLYQSAFNLEHILACVTYRRALILNALLLPEHTHNMSFPWETAPSKCCLHLLRCASPFCSQLGRAQIADNPFQVKHSSFLELVEGSKHESHTTPTADAGNGIQPNKAPCFECRASPCQPRCALPRNPFREQEWQTVTHFLQDCTRTSFR